MGRQNANSTRCLKNLSALIFWFGLGNFWYEKVIKSSYANSKIFKFVYVSYGFTFIIVYFLLVCMETAAIFRPNITTNDWRDAVNFSIAHWMILGKWINLLYQQVKIRELIHCLVVKLKTYHQNDELDKNELKVIIIYSVMVTAATHGTLVTGSLDSAIKALKFGEVYSTLVVYWPPSDLVSDKAFYARIGINLFWWYFISVMIATDILATGTLIMLAHRFKLVQDYFRSLKDEYDEMYMKFSPHDMERHMRQAFVKGISLHCETLWCAERAQNVWAGSFACQLVQTATMLIILFVQIVAAEKSLTALLAKLVFIVAMLVLLGIFMWSCGEVTYEAARVADAMYDSGWHTVLGRNSEMKYLVVLACQKANIPVVFTAFGVINMSYNAFILVVKNSYSVFAVLY